MQSGQLVIDFRTAHLGNVETLVRSDVGTRRYLDKGMEYLVSD